MQKEPYKGIQQEEEEDGMTPLEKYVWDLL
jgi:hypothetical protein